MASHTASYGAEPNWNDGGTIVPRQSIDTDTRIHLERTLTLDIGAGHNVRLRGDMSSSAYFLPALIKQGDGQLELWGNNRGLKLDVVLEGGYLHLAHHHALGDGATLYLNPGTTISYAPGITIVNPLQPYGMATEPAVRWHVESGIATQVGMIHGDLSLVKTGAGTLALNNQTFSPGSRLAIDKGAVLLRGHFAGHIAVHHGATLAGSDGADQQSGRAGQLHVQPGGTLAPLYGLTVSSDLTFDPGSRLQLRAWPDGQVDQLEVAWGTPQLHGDVLVLPQEHHQAWIRDTEGVILKSNTEAIQGRFASVHSAVPWLEPSLHYDSHAVRLQLRLRQGKLSPINDNFSTGWAATVRNMLAEDSRFVREAVYLHAAQQNRFWMHALHSSGDFNNGNRQHAHRHLGGLLLGANHDIAPHWKLGLYGGASRTHADGHGAGTGAGANRESGVGPTSEHQHAFNTGATLNTLHIGAHTRLGRPDVVRLVVGAAYSRHRVQSHRTTGFHLPSDTLHSRYRAHTHQVFAEARYPLWRSHDQRQRIEPLIRLAWVRIKQDAHAEQDHTLALVRSTDHIRTVFTTLGVHGRQERALPLGNVALEGTLAWRHAHGDTHKGSQQYFRGDPLQRAIKTNGIAITRNAWQLQLAMQAQLNKRSHLGLAWSGQYGHDYKDHGVLLTLNSRW